MEKWYTESKDQPALKDENLNMFVRKLSESAMQDKDNINIKEKVKWKHQAIPLIP